jgi:hypothetical protein
MSLPSMSILANRPHPPKGCPGQNVKDVLALDIPTSWDTVKYKAGSTLLVSEAILSLLAG